MGPCADCGGEMRRVPEVIDVWFDSGSMPFAQHHAPFENQELLRGALPRRLHLRGDRPDARLVLLAARDLDAAVRPARRTGPCSASATSPTREGKKMSKSLGNIVVPWDVIDRHGADAFRWYFLTSKQPWDGYLFSVETVGESVRQFLLQLWNTYGFYVLYANVNGVEPDAHAGPANDLDRWALSRLAGDRRDRHRAPRRLRRHARRPRDRGLRRRPLELVRAPLAPALLGRRPGRLRDAAHLPRDGRQAARAVHAVRGRRDLRQPRRLRAERAPDATGPSRASATSELEFAMASRARPSGSGSRRAGRRS